MELSPLAQYCESFDSRFIDKSLDWTYQYAKEKIPTDYFSSLFLKEIQFRADHHQNNLIDVEAEQASGKSLFSIDLSIRIGTAYNYPFVLERDIYINPMDLEPELRKEGDRRRTFLYDEQPKRKAGIGSGTADLSLSDWQDIARYTQKNIIKCSPETYEVRSYFWFRQVDYQIKRLENKKCVNCSEYSRCQASFYKTLCDTGEVDKKIPFWERDGYPLNFSFMLYTKRLRDKLFVPRGVVSLPMVTPATALKYDEVKKENIDRFESFNSGLWNKKLGEMDIFILENFNHLTKKKEKKFGTIIMPESKAVIEGWFYTKFGTQKYTRDEVGIFLGLIKQKLNEKCQADSVAVVK